MAIDLNSSISCVHCGRTVPLGRFCADCGMPLHQACPRTGDGEIPLTLRGKPTSRCPDCGHWLSVCSVCHRLYDGEAGVCRTENCGGSLQPTALFSYGFRGGSARNAAGYLYLNELGGQPGVLSLEPLSGEVIQGGYAGERLAVLYKAKSGEQALALYRAAANGERPLEQMALPGNVSRSIEQSLLMNAEYAGVLTAEGGVLVHTQPPMKKTAEITTRNAPFSQTFTSRCWWLLTESGGRVTVLCRDLFGPQERTLETEVRRESLLTAVGTPNALMLVERNGTITRIDGATLQLKLQTPQLELDSTVRGAAFYQKQLYLLSTNSEKATVSSWSLETERGERLFDVSLAETGPADRLAGPILTPNLLCFYGPRTAVAWDRRTRQMQTERLPAATEIKQVIGVTTPKQESLLIRTSESTLSRWESWTPGQSASRVALGKEILTDSRSGLTDTGIYALVEGGGRCDIRVWQYA